MALELDRLGVSYEREKRVTGRFFADFVLSDSPVVIECDGEFWHSSEKAKRQDARKDIAYREAGYIVFRLTGSEINSDITGAVQRILEVVSVGS